MSQPRPVFFISDGTGITAETIGHSLLTQFNGSEFRTLRIPFVEGARRRRRDSRRGRAGRGEADRGQLGGQPGPGRAAA